MVGLDKKETVFEVCREEEWTCRSKENRQKIIKILIDGAGRGGAAAAEAFASWGELRDAGNNNKRRKGNRSGTGRLL